MVSEVRERQPHTRQVEQERPIQYIDVLPADLLSLLELPEEPVGPGDRVEVTTPMGTMKLDVGAREPCSYSECGNLQVPDRRRPGRLFMIEGLSGTISGGSRFNLDASTKSTLIFMEQ